MATYLEIRQLFNDSDLYNKIQVASTIAAEAIRVEDAATDNHANRLLWAKSAFESPNAVAKKMIMAVLAGNADLTVAQIQGATDAAIQTKVDAAVDIFAVGN